MEEKFCPSCEEPVIDKLPPCPLQCMVKNCKAYKKEEKINVTEKPIIWLLGGPGSGKGTQSKKIVQKYGFTHISTGDILRAEADSGSDRAKCLTNVLKRGGLVPTDIVLKIVKDEMMKNVFTAKGYIVDGYPRAKDQGLAFERGIASPSAIIYMEAKPEILLSRLMGQSAKSDRLDDTEEAIKLRIETFLINNKDILIQYRDKAFAVNAEANEQAIFNEIQQVIDPIVEKAKAAAFASAPSPATNKTKE